MSANRSGSARADRGLPILCPSGRCRPGAILLGVINSDATVGYITQQITVDREFVCSATKVGIPEKRFRFSEPCVESGCEHWTGRSCGVVEELLACVDVAWKSSTLPACSIRARCRWYEQEGRRACEICPVVVTDNRLLDLSGQSET